jgi:hypothetical protein
MTTTEPELRMSPRSVRVLVIAVVAVVLLALIVTLVNRTWPGAGDDHDRRVTVPLNSRHSAGLAIESGADRIIVTSADLGGDLAEVTTPGAAAKPQVKVLGDDLYVQAQNPPEIAVRLARGVRWDLTLDGGAKQIVLDLGATPIRSVTLNGGADHAEITLPAPDRPADPEVPVALEIKAGLGSAAVHVPNGVPVQVTFTGGAGVVTVDGKRVQGVAAQTTITGMQAAAGAVGLRANVAGIGTFTVDRLAH